MVKIKKVETPVKEEGPFKPPYSVARVADETFELELDTQPWTNGPFRTAQIPSWGRHGERQPRSKRGLDKTHDSKFLKRINPFRNLYIFPSVDQYTGEQRALFRLLMNENSWISRANKILRQLTITKSTRTPQPRGEDELTEEALEKWEQTPIFVPLWNRQATPLEINLYVDKLCTTLAFDQLLFDAFLYNQEQGRTCIGMFPELRNKDGHYKIPQALKLFNPELMRRPIISIDDGSLFAIEITQLTSNGGRLDANRAIYITTGKTNEFANDFYGPSELESIQDIGKTMLVIAGQDMMNFAQRTWRTPHIWQHELPSKEWSKVNTRLDDFNFQMNQNDGKEVSITSNVKLVNPNPGNPGDVDGIIKIWLEGIDTIAGYFGIPPFRFAKGKAGNLGGTANKEEDEAFLQHEIKPLQELWEAVAEDQMYDRILAILFMVEPEEADIIPIKIRHNFEKPVLPASIPIDEWNIMMFLEENNFTTMEQVMERYGLRDMLQNSPTMGVDTTPGQNTFNPWKKHNHPTWDNKIPRGWKPRKLKNKFFMHKHDEIDEKKKTLLDSVNDKVKAEAKIAKREAQKKNVK